MSFSSLVDGIVEADSSNYTQGRNGYSICKITPHHMAGILTAQRCGELFQNPNRNGSSNYGIGNDGEIYGYVDENNRAWTSGNRENDFQAITIEVSNCEIGGEWRVSDEAWNSLVKLCVDICKRYNFRLYYDGTPNGSLTNHDMFQSTTCPGPYLKSRMSELEITVNRILDEEAKKPLIGKKSDLQYRVHVENLGWSQWYNDGEIAGTENKGLRIEAIQFQLKNGIELKAKAHIEKMGWTDWKNGTEIIGTEGKALRLEALEIECNRELKASEHIQYIGWLPSSNGIKIKLGTETKGLRLEALKIKLV